MVVGQGARTQRSKALQREGEQVMPSRRRSSESGPAQGLEPPGSNVNSSPAAADKRRSIPLPNLETASRCRFLPHLHHTCATAYTSTLAPSCWLWKDCLLYCRSSCIYISRTHADVMLKVNGLHATIFVGPIGSSTFESAFWVSSVALSCAFLLGEISGCS